VADRITEGNFQYDAKVGKVVRVPVNARDAHKIAVELMDKEELLEQRLAHLNKAQESKTEDVLVKLAAQFAAMAQGKPQPSTDVIDVEFKEVTDD
jgi:chaperonin cofactor prefoldin